MLKRFLILSGWFLLQVGFLQAQNLNNYPGRYMGKEELKTLTAPNGAVANAGFAQTLQLIYPQPTIIKDAEGIWADTGRDASISQRYKA